MNRFLLAFLCATLIATALQSSGTAEVLPSGADDRPLTRHLDTALSQMDRGLSSAEYRESLAFLRTHAADANAAVRELLLEETGGFRKWQVTYLVGEFGDEGSIALLRLLIDEPLPRPEPSREGRHEIDLAYTEELASRVQAVMSIARVASHRPDLRDQVIVELLDAARRAPMVKSTALFELRKLLGSEFQTLRGYFRPEDAKHFAPFVPPPQWQALLRRRTKKHERQERELRERRQPLCHLD